MKKDIGNNIVAILLIIFLLFSMFGFNPMEAVNQTSDLFRVASEPSLKLIDNFPNP